MYTFPNLMILIRDEGGDWFQDFSGLKKNNNKKTKDAQALYIKWSSTADIWIHRLWSVDFADAEIAVPEGWLYV